MILPVDISPKDSLYYIGGITLEILKENVNSFGFIDLFSELNKRLSVNIGLFVLVLDWLFLIDAATVGEDGVVTLCLYAN